MKKIIFVFAFFTMFTLVGQDNKYGQKDVSGNLIGLATKASFQQEPFNKWFEPAYTSYKANPKDIAVLKKRLKKVTIRVFTATWCRDSKREMPALFKVLEAAEFDLSKVEIITLNRSRSTPDDLQEGHNLTHVPTMIFYKKGKEIGRFLEYSRETLEKDLIGILSGKPQIIQ